MKSQIEITLSDFYDLVFNTFVECGLIDKDGNWLIWK